MSSLFSSNFLLKSAAIISSCFFFLSCENDQKTLREMTEKKEMVEEAKNIETYLSQGSTLKAKLWAPYMLRYSNDSIYVEFPKTLHVNFFDSLGSVDSHLDAKYGKYFETQGKVYLRDSVLVYNLRGDSLRSPDLWWDQNTQTLYTDKPVWIKNQGVVLFGREGMNCKQDLSELHVRQIHDPSLIDLPDSLRPQ